ncbi:hypothetical protein OIU77_026507 [Salix suchowensis]|uniref:Uncharacterized protein n=1 Tax=Salix suchowensis TaxID=1278906 RepID=A0ABQ9BLD4_9ROSI|nr:hypothetical protein OIU77_026507 [Salix suchowensis]
MECRIWFALHLIGRAIPNQGSNVFPTPTPIISDMNLWLLTVFFFLSRSSSFACAIYKFQVRFICRGVPPDIFRNLLSSSTDQTMLCSF